MQLFLADLLVVAHFLFIMFVVFGGLLAVYRPWWAWLHLPAAAWGAAIEFGGWLCPLTPLEQQLRRHAGAESYTRSFIEHYLVPVIYPAALTRETQVAIGLVVVALNAAIYGYAIARNRSRAGRVS